MRSELEMLECLSECPGDASSEGSEGESTSQPCLFPVYLRFQNSCKIVAALNGVNRGPLFVR